MTFILRFIYREYCRSCFLHIRYLEAIPPDASAQNDRDSHLSCGGFHRNSHLAHRRAAASLPKTC